MGEQAPSPAVSVLCPAGASAWTFDALRPAAPFAADALGFVGALSRALVALPEARRWPEVMALGHWLRPRALADLERAFRATLPREAVALARGRALHFAPGNVDTLFVYSALLSVLMGNATIVRVSSRPSPQVDVLVATLNRVLCEFESVSCRLRVLRYGREAAEVTAALSAACDLRVIWGGDAAVTELRASPLGPRSRDLTFPDRWSLSVLDARAVLDAGAALPAVAEAFLRDGRTFDQRACSSPRLVLWHGPPELGERASDRFWAAVEARLEADAAPIDAVASVDKLVALHEAAILGLTRAVRPTRRNLVSVARLVDLALPPERLLSVGHGLFWEALLPDLDALAPLLDGRAQTLGSYGLDAATWESFVRRHGAAIDRIVPLGQALAFEVLWDGHDLLREFTRLVVVRAASRVIPDDLSANVHAALEPAP